MEWPFSVDEGAFGDEEPTPIPDLKNTSIYEALNRCHMNYEFSFMVTSEKVLVMESCFSTGPLETVELLAPPDFYGVRAPCDDIGERIAGSFEQKGISVSGHHVDGRSITYRYDPKSEVLSLRNTPENTRLIKRIIREVGCVVLERDMQRFPYILHLAVYFHDAEAVTFLVKQCGKDINQPDAMGATPLDWARSPEMKKHLISLGAQASPSSKE